MCRRKWFAEGHVEVAGEESVAAIGFWKKFFIYAKKGRAASQIGTDSGGV